MSIQKREEKIPKGLYCYDERGICPYWRRIDGREEQEDGWCDYLGKGDYEINREDKEVIQTTRENGKKIETKIHFNKDNPPPIPMSLLWDQCKECGINDDIDLEDYEEQ